LGISKHYFALDLLIPTLPENNQQISAKDLERGKKNIYLRIRLGVEGLRIGWCKREKRVRKRQVFYR